MTIKLNDNELAVVKAEIDEQLRVRCINVITTLTQKETKSGDVRLELTSSKFNTVPVIHSELSLSSFVSGVWKDKDDKTNFSIEVHVDYEGNGVRLFKISGIAVEDRIFFYGTEKCVSTYKL